jgi:hypothetical protein
MEKLKKIWLHCAQPFDRIEYAIYVDRSTGY